MPKGILPLNLCTAWGFCLVRLPQETYCIFRKRLLLYKSLGLYHFQLGNALPNASKESEAYPKSLYLYEWIPGMKWISCINTAGLYIKKRSHIRFSYRSQVVFVHQQAWQAFTNGKCMRCCMDLFIQGESFTVKSKSLELYLKVSFLPVLKNRALECIWIKETLCMCQRCLVFIRVTLEIWKVLA